MIKCSKCKSELEILEEDFESMSEGQQADYNAGLWRTCYCPTCKTSSLVEGHFSEPSFLDEEDYIDDTIDESTFEDLIDRAIDKRCFIEVISLVHNAIEFYLKKRLIKKIFPMSKEEYNDPSIKEKVNILENKWGSIKYMNDYKEMCFLFDLIKKDIYDKITKFNSLRNTAIHKLLKTDKKEWAVSKYKYGEIVQTAILGREIQLRLSPIDHSEKDVNKILERFKLEPEDSDDPFLSDYGVGYNIF